MLTEKTKHIEEVLETQKNPQTGKLLGENQTVIGFKLLSINKYMTFNEDFTHFRENCTSNRLFVDKYYSFNNSSINKILGFTCVITMVIGWLFLIFDNYFNIGIYLLVVSSLFLSLILLLDRYIIKKVLEKQNLPTNSMIYNFEGNELKNKRIHKILPIYTDIPINVIEGRIEIAKDQINELGFHPLLFIEKVFLFIGKQYLLITVGVFLYLLKYDFSINNFTTFYKIIHIVLLIVILIAFSWKISVRFIFLSNKFTKVRYLKDYIFIMKNIILLKQLKSE